jgi:hypothetical protein
MVHHHGEDPNKNKLASLYGFDDGNIDNNAGPFARFGVLPHIYRESPQLANTDDIRWMKASP